MQEQTRLIPLTDWNQFHPWPPQGGLRHLMFHRHSNGFSSAFIKCGRRVLVKEKAFFDAIANRRELQELGNETAAH